MALHSKECSLQKVSDLASTELPEHPGTESLRYFTEVAEANSQDQAAKIHTRIELVEAINALVINRNTPEGRAEYDAMNERASHLRYRANTIEVLACVKGTDVREEYKRAEAANRADSDDSKHDASGAHFELPGTLEETFEDFS